MSRRGNPYTLGAVTRLHEWQVRKPRRPKSSLYRCWKRREKESVAAAEAQRTSRVHQKEKMLEWPLQIELGILQESPICTTKSLSVYCLLGDEGLPGVQGEAVSVLEADDSWISRAIKGHKARPAPGMDGLGAPVLQLLWKWGHLEIHRLMVECLRAGVHCQNWKSARGVVIPKPGKDDYSLCKSYRVISLLSCLGKVLERVVCGLLELQVCRLGALHRGQFGSIRRRSAVDAVATLVTICEREWSKGRCVGALCMDVQAAFPSVNPA